MTYATDFPFFEANPGITYLDSAATSHLPQAVIDAVRDFSMSGRAAIHRGLYPLSVEATARYEETRAKAVRFIGATTGEIVFTSGTTDGLNLVAYGLGSGMRPGDEIIVSELEHHANLLPWRSVPGIIIRYAPITAGGVIDLDAFERLVSDRTRAVAVTLCSNVLGTVQPVSEIKKILEKRGSDAAVIVDAAQAVAHFPLSVHDLGCDFLAFSGHKIYGPTGTGILWGREPLLSALPPYRVGGDMVRFVSKDAVEWAPSPQRFEGGTPNLDGIIGLGAAFDYLEGVGMATIEAHVARISTYALEKLRPVNGLVVLGEPDPRSGIISFAVEGVHAHDIAEALGERGICVRAGHHCAAPLHQALGIAASCRISLGIYNDEADIDTCVGALETVIADYRA